MRKLAAVCRLPCAPPAKQYDNDRHCSCEQPLASPTTSRRASSLRCCLSPADAPGRPRPAPAGGRAVARQSAQLGDRAVRPLLPTIRLTDFLAAAYHRKPCESLVNVA